MTRRVRALLLLVVAFVAMPFGTLVLGVDQAGADGGLIFTTTTMSASENPIAVGHDVTYTASVTPAGATGTITFTESSTNQPLEGCQGLVPVGGTATCTVRYESTGFDVVRATFSATAPYFSSRSGSFYEVMSKTPCRGFVGCNLSRLDLTSASLPFTDLSRTNFNRTILKGAGLFGADLSHANLNGADLTQADLRTAVLSGANLHNVRWSSTMCPDGTNSDSDGETCVGHL